MELSRLGLIALAASSLALIPTASATPTNSFTVGSTYSGLDSNQTSGKMNVNYNGKLESQAAGNFNGSTGVINGTSVVFSAVYCVDLNDYITLGKTYNTSVSYSTSGIVNGAAVGSSTIEGEIAWLLLNEAPAAGNNEAMDEALQAAIWYEEYGVSASFTLDPSTANYTTIHPYFIADLNAVSAVSASVLAADISKVEWITPSSSNNVQGQVALVVGGIPNGTPSPTPEPGSLALLGTGMLGVAGAVRRRSKKA